MLNTAKDRLLTGRSLGPAQKRAGLLHAYRDR